MKSRIKYLFFSCFSLAVILGFFVSCGSSPNTTASLSSSRQQPVDRQSRVDLYMRYLQNEGHNPSIDEDGDILFSLEDIDFFVRVNERDPSFTMIVLPNIYAANTDAELEMAAAAAAYTNNATKVAKVFLVGPNDNVAYIAVEIYLENPNDFAVLFSRFINDIYIALNQFFS
jgi:hypothetical protein